MGFIYKITSPTGRLYIGKTKHLQRRINTYKYKITNDTGWKNAKIMNSLKKYGWDAHIFEIIEECENELLNDREKFWIKKLDTYCVENNKNMNMSRGGEEGGRVWMFDVERRKKQSERFTGVGGPFYGKKHTEENKRKQSERAKKQAIERGTKIPEWGAEKGRNIIRRPVLCYDSNGIFLKEFTCGSQASKEMKLDHTSISMVCNLKRSNVGGFIFRYKIENYPLKIEIRGIKTKQEERGLFYLDKDYSIIKEYPSAKYASVDLHIPKTTINRAAMYNWLKPIMSGHIFIYKDLYKEALKKAKKGEVKQSRREIGKSRSLNYKQYLKDIRSKTALRIVGEQSFLNGNKNKT